LEPQVAFEWDGGNIAHLKRHRGSSQEIEEVFQNEPLDLEYDIEAGEERYKSLGATVPGTHSDCGLDGQAYTDQARNGVRGVRKVSDTVLGIQRNAMKKLKIPVFRSEASEARWWYVHREVLDRDFEEAAKAGTLKTLTREELLKRLSASRVISIRLPEDDLERLRRLAAQNGLPYQTYMKSLLHQALEREEKRRAS